MKYLYLLFRLFKCPHTWKTLAIKPVQDSDQQENNLYAYKIVYCECIKCGKPKVFKLKH